ncbi:MAG TPA: tetratricopeptide repeat protein [Chloroflexota bacterium]|nr:tetratricopeptide repeat protein [Chloroflexota bacterium]
MNSLLRISTFVAASCLAATNLLAQPPAPAADPASALIKESQQQLHDGHLDQALATARKAMASYPKSSAVHEQVGVLLDLTGQYAEARQHFKTAIDTSASPQESSRALRSMAMSYGFEGDCKSAVTYESQLYDRNVSSGDFTGAGEVANELARVCLESGDVDTAETWYRKGYEAGLKTPDLKETQRDLWNFRWEHAQARIASRRGDQSSAATHVAAAKAIIDKGSIPEQSPFLPYLTGYVAYYKGAYAQAISDLGKANQNDPLILCLTAQALEKTGEAARAKEIYQQILSITSHNPTNAYARPIARKKLAS